MKIHVHNPRWHFGGGEEEEVLSLEPIYAETGEIKAYKVYPEYAFLTPTGKAIIIPSIDYACYSIDGQLLRFITTDKKQYGVISIGNSFIGYIDIDKAKDNNLISDNINEGAKHLTPKNIDIIKECIFKNFRFAENTDFIDCRAKLLVGDILYNNCICRYEFIAENKHLVANQNPINRYFQGKEVSIQGEILNNLIPISANNLGCEGDECPSDYSYLSDNNITNYIYGSLIDLIDKDMPNETKKLFELAEFIGNEVKDKTFGFYGHGTENYFAGKKFSEEVMKFFRREKIFTLKKFNTYFPKICTSSDIEVIFSDVNLWEGIKNDYNAYSIDWDSFHLDIIKTKKQLYFELYKLESFLDFIIEQDIEELPYDAILSSRNFINYCYENTELVLERKFELIQNLKGIYASLGAYNVYEYRFADLSKREFHKRKDDRYFYEILKMENNKNASAIAVHEAYEQYINQYNTDKAFFFGQEYLDMISLMYMVYGAAKLTPKYAASQIKNGRVRIFNIVSHTQLFAGLMTNFSAFNLLRRMSKISYDIESLDDLDKVFSQTIDVLAEEFLELDINSLKAGLLESYDMLIYLISTLEESSIAPNEISFNAQGLAHLTGSIGGHSTKGIAFMLRLTLGYNVTKKSVFFKILVLAPFPVSNHTPISFINIQKNYKTLLKIKSGFTPDMLKEGDKYLKDMYKLSNVSNLTWALFMDVRWYDTFNNTSLDDAKKLKNLVNYWNEKELKSEDITLYCEFNGNLPIKPYQSKFVVTKYINYIQPYCIITDTHLRIIGLRLGYVDNIIKNKIKISDERKLLMKELDHFGKDINSWQRKYEGLKFGVVPFIVVYN